VEDGNAASAAGTAGVSVVQRLYDAVDRYMDDEATGEHTLEHSTSHIRHHLTHAQVAIVRAGHVLISCSARGA